MAEFSFSTKRKIAAMLAAAFLLMVLVPLQFASADDGVSNNGYITVWTPMNGDVTNQGLFVRASANNYVFKVETFDGTGAPLPIGHYGLVVTAADTDSHPVCASSGNAQCIYSSGGTNNGDNSFTVSIPATAIAMGGELPGNGVSIYVTLWNDGAGTDYRLDGGRIPTGYYNQMVPQFFAKGEYHRADQADDRGSPVFLMDMGLDGIVSPGNPFLNPGFEISLAPSAPTDIPVGAAGVGGKTVMAPWALFIADDMPGMPESEHFLAGNCGAGGSCASIHIAAADANERLIFGQFFTPPTATTAAGASAWVAGDSTIVSFDARTNGAFGWRATTTLHFLDATGVEQQVTKSQSAANAITSTWSHVSYDFSADIPAGSQLTSAFISFLWNWGGYEIIQLDNAAITGASLMFAPPVPTTENDLNDGYSAFIVPQNGALTSGGSVVLNLVTLNDGPAYVFEISAEDYTAATAKAIDMNGPGAVSFQVLDSDFAFDGGRTENVLYQTSSLVRFAEDGTVSKRALVVVPDSVSGSIVPWVFKHLTTAPGYTDTFGTESQPVSAYHSVVRNGMRGLALADAFDYAATPIVLSGVVGGSLVAPTDITVECPAAAPGTACTSDPTPTVVVNYSTGSQMLESVTMTLTSVDGSVVLGTATFATPSGTASFTLTEAQIASLEALGDLRIVAKVEGARFAADATSVALHLGNNLPIADFTLTPATGGNSQTFFRVSDASSDSDGSIVARTWNVEFVNDATPDADDITPGSTIHSRPNSQDPGVNQQTFSFRVPDDGEYTVTLTVEDNERGTTTVVRTFNVDNMVPTATATGPIFAKPNVAALFTVAAIDVDGIIDRSMTTWTTTPATSVITGTPDSATIAFTAEGPYTVTVTGKDDDGAAFTATRSVLVDGTGAISGVSIPAVPASGWFTAPVDVTVTRSDALSGVRSTRTTVDGGSVMDHTGDATVVRSVSGDGTHVFAAVSTDLANNVGAPATTTFGIDATPPTVAMTTDSTVPGAPIFVFTRGEQVVLKADAADVTSGMSKVEFYVEDRLIGVDTDGNDGWTTVYDANTPGWFPFTAKAYDVAGNVATSAAQTYFILDL